MEADRYFSLTLFKNEHLPEKISVPPSKSDFAWIVGYLSCQIVCEFSPLVPRVELSNNSDCVGCGFAV
ncbi:MAG: hypothetical protein J5582_06800 [Ruminococcus sp.]|nr:hypothetical protein [Ruminococcus sp.]